MLFLREHVAIGQERLSPHVAIGQERLSPRGVPSRVGLPVATVLPSGLLNFRPRLQRMSIGYLAVRVVRSRSAFVLQAGRGANDPDGGRQGGCAQRLGRAASRQPARAGPSSRAAASPGRRGTSSSCPAAPSHRFRSDFESFDGTALSPRPSPRAPQKRRNPLPERARSTATGIRTPVSAVRGRRPSPLDDGGAPTRDCSGGRRGCPWRGSRMQLVHSAGGRGKSGVKPARSRHCERVPMRRMEPLGARRSPGRRGAEPQARRPHSGRSPYDPRGRGGSMSVWFRCALSGALILVSLAAPAAADAVPVTVNLRVEGATQTIFEGPVITDVHQVKTPVRHRGAHRATARASASRPRRPRSARSMTRRAAAPSRWDALWDAGFSDYYPFLRIGPDAIDSSTHYLAFYLNWAFAETGGCGQHVRQGDEVLFAYEDFQPSPHPAPVGAGRRDDRAERRAEGGRRADLRPPGGSERRRRHHRRRRDRDAQLRPARHLPSQGR